MSIDYRLQQIQNMLAKAEDVARRLEQSEKGSGGDGGGFSHLDRRVDRLESQYDKVRTELSAVNVELARLSEKVSNLPGKSYVATLLTSMLALIAALVIFVDKIKAMIG